jgi:hypothetical protein
MTLTELKQEVKNMVEKEFPTLTGTAKEMLIDATIEVVIRKQLKEREQHDSNNKNTRRV